MILLTALYLLVAFLSLFLAVFAGIFWFQAHTFKSPKHQIVIFATATIFGVVIALCSAIFHDLFFIFMLISFLF
jgi:hypothetical protein